MIKQLIAKSFYDGLDNFVKLVLTNVIFAACVIGVGFSRNIFLIALFTLMASFHFLGVNGMAIGIVEESGRLLANYTCAIKKFGHFVLFTLGLFIVLLDFFFVIPWYFSAAKLIWYIAGFVVLYLAIMICMVLQYYYPLCLAYEEDNPFETLKKSLVFLFSNFGFSAFCFLKNMLDLAISVATIFLLPGLSGVAITQNTAVEFIILQKQWMNEKKVDKRNASADLFLAPEMEKYQGRSLKNFLFPGK